MSTASQTDFGRDLNVPRFSPSEAEIDQRQQVGDIFAKIYTKASTKRGYPMPLVNGGCGYQK